MHARGLTLIELLITVTILGILLAIGVPSFQKQLAASRARTAADTLLQAIQLTRSKAISSNRRATLRKLGHWHSGWEVFYDRDFDGERDPDEPQIVTAGPLTGVTVSANTPLSNYVSFIGSGESRFAGTLRGGGFQAGTLTICPQNGGDGYQLVLARSGRVRVISVSEEDC
ncbi:GspH/FimT family pseudopilin [Microbulbifer hydrolyticus]|uniref:Type II secretion system protein H n=1 Tax=Microbulbifer hydrolyticus TaxID=48074 RepID=A0A6P1TFU1_9GAMM|nr:GspH/FimT family pseudopilin [Microbulbifer hydrolyticus]MBB5210917.1 type IV fimbrial biogenesis protein FimT [Microbulbifer hydrolyticus]QHQ40711.1 prepilin-type N-terminal cleavage/methylation domain-containing protein [Microbulbifer hydrolyticus]